MAQLRVVSGREAVKAFEKAGWSRRDLKRRQRTAGSHHTVLTKEGEENILSVPDHTELATGTLRSLIRAAGMTVEEFNALL